MTETYTKDPPNEFIDRWLQELLAKGVKWEEAEFCDFAQNMWDHTRQAMRAKNFQGSWQAYLDQEKPAKKGSAKMTTEEIGKMTREEAMEAFAVSSGKPGLETEYRSLKLELLRETQNPELTDEQRAFLFKILVDL